jgi:uncharacterized protein YbjT (DUF2867 family)
MTFLRHASRAVQNTVLTRVKDQITTLGWTVEADLPFGTDFAAVVTFTDTPAITPSPSGPILANGVGPGLVAVTLGDEFMAEEQEVGGPLSKQDFPLFFDVLQSSHGAALALANDIRDTLMGRFAGNKRVFPIVDPVTGDDVPGWTCELTDIEIVRPEIRLPVHWQVVKVTAETYFPEEQV